MNYVERIDGNGILIELAGIGADRRQLLQDGQAVHRELRGEMPENYTGFAEGLISEGASLTQIFDRDEVRGLAVWRVFTTTYCGLRFEVDDLVVAAAERSRGYGHTLLSYLEKKASGLGCNTLTLNSATHRSDAHRFYFTNKYEIFGFHFSKDLS
jgi:GNAT superfamily N-acetyltransferase